MKDCRRLFFVGFFLLFLFACLIGRFFQVQIIEKDKWTRLALNQHRCRIAVPFMRGKFFSCSQKKSGDILFF